VEHFFVDKWVPTFLSAESFLNPELIIEQPESGWRVHNPDVVTYLSYRAGVWIESYIPPSIGQPCITLIRDFEGTIKDANLLK
jgi:hypothetical protein